MKMPPLSPREAEMAYHQIADISGCFLETRLSIRDLQRFEALLGEVSYDPYKKGHSMRPSEIENSWCSDGRKKSDEFMDLDVGANSYEPIKSEKSKINFVFGQSPVRKTAQLALNKPLPPLPTEPYFEYMFADAGLEEEVMESENTPDNLILENARVFGTKAYSSFPISPYAAMDWDESEANSSHASSVIKNEPTTPTTFAFGSEIHGFDFINCGEQAVDSKILEDNYAMLAGTGLAGGALHIDHDAPKEELEASEGFFGGFAAEQASGPFYAPLIHETGYGDVRDGLEDHPEFLLKHQEEEQVNLLQPIPVRVEHGGIATIDISAHPDLTKFPIVDIGEFSQGLPFFPQGQLQGKAFATAERKFLGKRKASAASLTCSDNPICSGKGHPIKKPRLHEYLWPYVDVEEYLRPPSSRPIEDAADQLLKPLTYSPGNYLAKEHLKPLVIGQEFSRLSPSLYSSAASHTEDGVSENESMQDESTDDESIPDEEMNLYTATLKGFPGQFKGAVSVESYIRANEPASNGGSDKWALTMGDPSHPNGTFIHTNFHACPYYGDMDYQQYNAHSATSIGAKLCHAEKMADEAAETPRTKEEETLRRELHLECTNARLEGVSVGQYRYYQGHMVVEDYKEANICVCWDICSCSKMCSRFADIICPCSASIVLVQD